MSEKIIKAGKTTIHVHTNDGPLSPEQVRNLTFGQVQEMVKGKRGRMSWEQFQSWMVGRGIGPGTNAGRYMKELWFSDGTVDSLKIN